MLKESNSGETPTLFEDKKFWFNDTAAEPQTKSQEERRSYSIRCTYARKFVQTLKCLNKPENQPFAYMNLNKRGGFGSTNYCRLKNYTAKYKKFILKQIQLHNPKVILFCGCYNDIAQILFNTDKNKNSIKQWNNKPVDIIFNQKHIRLLGTYHPAYNKFDGTLCNILK